jgi:mono/diheme cytochrome c family protein
MIPDPEIGPMRVFRLVSVLGPLAAFAACASSGGSSSSSSSTPTPTGGGLLSTIPEFTPALIDSGKALFSKRPCIQCHGANGIGTVNGPNLADKNWLRGEGNYNMIVTIIINGVGQSDVVGGYSRGMPRRGRPIDEYDMRQAANRVELTDAEVRALAVYVCSLSDCRKS